MQATTDNEIMKMVQRGDVNKLGLLYEKYHKDLYQYFYRLTRQREKSEDLVHNVFIKVMKYSKNFKGQGQFVYWMYSIARNSWIDELRKQDVLKQTKDLADIKELKEEASVADQLTEQEEQKRLINMALDQLSADKKEAIIMSRYQGMKYHEIAQVVDCTENTVKSRIRRGLMEMKTIIEKVQTY